MGSGEEPVNATDPTGLRQDEVWLAGGSSSSSGLSEEEKAAQELKKQEEEKAKRESVAQASQGEELQYLDPDNPGVFISRGPNLATRVRETIDNELSRFTARNFLGMDATDWVKTMDGRQIPMSEYGFFSNRDKDIDRAFVLITAASSVFSVVKAVNVVSLAELLPWAFGK